MKFNKIARLCKETGCVQLYTDEHNNQYLSNGIALYPIYGLPLLDIENVKNLMGLNDTQRETWSFKVNNEINTIYTDDTYNGEELLQPLPISLNWKGNILGCYASSTGIFMVNRKHIETLSCNGEIELFLRINIVDSLPCYIIVAKSGLINYGAITPFPVQQDMSDCINELATMIKISTDNRNTSN